MNKKLIFFFLVIAACLSNHLKAAKPQPENLATAVSIVMATLPESLVDSLDAGFAPNDWADATKGMHREQKIELVKKIVQELAIAQEYQEHKALMVAKFIGKAALTGFAAYGIILAIKTLIYYFTSDISLETAMDQARFGVPSPYIPAPPPPAIQEPTPEEAFLALRIHADHLDDRTSLREGGQRWLAGTTVPVYRCHDGYYAPVPKSQR
jgi:hypothetical protein